MVTVFPAGMVWIFQLGGSLAASRYQPSTMDSFPTAAPQTTGEEVEVNGSNPVEIDILGKAHCRKLNGAVLLQPAHTQFREVNAKTVLPP